MPFVDFAELKSRTTIENVAHMMGLVLKRKGNQFRAACPMCKSGGDRAIVITPEKGAFYCFPGKVGGDMLKLAAHVTNVSVADAANFINQQLSGTVRTSSLPSPTTPEANEKGTKALTPLDYLQARHEAVQGLGVEEETATLFGAGYAPRGILRTRMALPIHTRDGTLVAYTGRSVKDESPVLAFPNGFNPRDHIFNQHRVEPGPLTVVFDPLQVLVLHQTGLTNVVSFLTEDVTPAQLVQLASLMDDKGCEAADFF